MGPFVGSLGCRRSCGVVSLSPLRSLRHSICECRSPLTRLSGFDPLNNFFRVVSSEFSRRGEPEMGLNGL